MRALLLLPFLLLTFISLAQPGPDAASLSADQQTYNKAVEAYKASQFSEAFSLFKKAADAGNPVANRALGIMYYNGKGVGESKSKSFEYYGKAAKAGDGVAMYNLAAQYFYGEGVTENIPEAMNWFNQSAMAGNPAAIDFVSQEEAKLRNPFYRGQMAMAEKNYKLALQNFRQSIAEGNSNGMYEVGRMILLHQGIDSSAEAAKAWFRKSATIGNAKGFIGLDLIAKLDGGKITRPDFEKSLTEASGSTYTNGFYTLPANNNSVELICSLCKGSGLVPGSQYTRVTRNGKTTYGKYEPCPVCNARKMAKQ